MARKRDTYNYDLIHGQTVVYRGITNNPDRRVDQHAQEGKIFDFLRLKGPAKTRSHARADEVEALRTYRRGHRGQNPYYNLKYNG